MAHKLRNYIDYLRHPDAWRGQFQRFPVVLIPTTTEERVEKVLIEGQHRLKLLGDDELPAALFVPQKCDRIQQTEKPPGYQTNGGFTSTQADQH